MICVTACILNLKKILILMDLQKHKLNIINFQEGTIRQKNIYSAKLFGFFFRE